MDWSLILNKLIIPAAVTIGAYAWNRITKRKETKQEQRTLLDEIVENFIYELLDVYPLNVPVETYLKNSRGYIDRRLWMVAEKRGIPRNKATERLAHIAIERGTKLLSREILKLKNYNAQLRGESK
jgi:hypothetical protein